MIIMRYLSMFIIAISFVVANLALAGPRNSADQDIGQENHPKIIAQSGGEIDTGAAIAFVERIGRELIQHSDQPDDIWTFTILDTPKVNAFATPGGFVYVTRGLLALANDEAELAAVLAHEISHVTADHLGARNDQGGEALRTGLFGAIVGGLLSGGEDRIGNAIKSGIMATIGHMAEFNQAQEFEADKRGVQMLMRAGYDPYAQADFLDHLAAKSTLESLISGREYNPNEVEFFASHPATGERVRQAILEAENAGQTAVRTARNEQDYLDVIEGLIYGDTPSQGYVRGRKFIHPILRFAFEVPEGFVIANTTRTVEASGPNGATLVLSGDRPPRGSLTDYIANSWGRQIAGRERSKPLRDLHSLQINGLEAATAILPIQNGQRELRLTVILNGRTLYRIAGSAEADGGHTLNAILEASKTFRGLEEREAELVQPYRIRIHKVSWLDTVKTLSRRFPFDSYNEQRFRTLNGLGDTEELRRGDLVKLIVE